MSVQNLSNYYIYWEICSSFSDSLCLYSSSFAKNLASLAQFDSFKSVISLCSYSYTFLNFSLRKSIWALNLFSVSSLSLMYCFCSSLRSLSDFKSSSCYALFSYSIFLIISMHFLTSASFARIFSLMLLISAIWILSYSIFCLIISFRSSLKASPYFFSCSWASIIYLSFATSYY